MPRDLKPPLKQRTRGRWRGLLPLFGLSPKIMNGKHHPCPMCGGKDRFRFDDKDGHGTYFCSQCGAGDGIKLVMGLENLEFKEAAKKIEAVIGDVGFIEPPKGRSDEDKRKVQRELWHKASPITKDDPAGRYLQSRLGDLVVFPRCLRYVKRAVYFDDRISNHPAMLAVVQAPNGQVTNVHRTYLDPSGTKAKVPEVRKMMAGDIEKGSAIRLFPYFDDTLGVAEGIETAWAAHLMHDIPVWSTVNATMLSEWEPPEDIKKVVIFGDNDKSFTGQAAAYALARRLAVMKDRSFEIDVRFPLNVGEDWNDVYRKIALA